MKTRIIQLSALLAFASSTVMQATENITTEISEITTEEVANNQTNPTNLKKPVKKTIEAQDQSACTEATDEAKDCCESKADTVKTVINPAVDATIKQATTMVLAPEITVDEKKVENQATSEVSNPETIN